MENMKMQLAEMRKSVVERATEDIQKGITDEKWIGRAVCEKNPRDYYELQLECDENKQMVEVKQWTIKGNVAVDMQESAMYISDMETDCMRAFVESTFHNSKLVSKSIEENFDLNMPEGQNPFKVYLSYEPGELQSHEKVLEEMQDISQTITKSGFKQTDKLVNNIRRFSELEGKAYSIEELAELKQKNPNFDGNKEKKECFDEIVKEFQEQEMQKVSFLKQEMLMEQELIAGV